MKIKPKGYWTKDPPTEPGEYALADHRGNVLSLRMSVVKHDNGGLLLVMPGRNTYVWKEAWGAWRWSVPIEFDFPPVSL